jgi:putative DNA primase/helicase
MGDHDGEWFGDSSEAPVSLGHHGAETADGRETQAAIRKAINQDAKKPKKPLTDVKTGLPKGFKLTDKGLFYLEERADDEGKTKSRNLYVGSPLKVTAETRSKDQNQWGRLLEWSDRDEHPHVWAIPMSMLEGEPSAVCAVLADGGLIIGGGSKVRNLLVRYIKECEPAAKARCINRIGWHGGVYVLPNQTLGENRRERVLFQGGAASTGDFQQRGTAAEWRDSVAALCAGNSRPMTAIGFAFAASLLHFMAGGESGGAHFRGDSSCGKSTILWAAASVYGPPAGDDSFRKEWRATGNGLEGLATSRNDSLLILDEMGQVDGKEAGTIAYMLANGQPKLRMSDAALLRKAPSWRLLFLSSGEISLADHMAAADRKIKAGQENRLADIPAMPMNGFGVFETLNGHPSGPALSVAIREAAGRCHGAVGLAFIEHVTRVQDTLPERIKSFIARFVHDVVPPGASGQVHRVAERFGLVAVALELAAEFGLTGWDPSTGTGAVKACFKDWLHQRGGAGDHEETAILSQVQAFFEANGESRFSDWDFAEKVVTHQEEDRRATVNRVGFRQRSQLEGYTYYVLPEAFKNEICTGLNPDRAVQVLKAAGWIEPDNQGKSSQRRRLPGFGKPTRCYVFTSKMWDSA